MLDLIDVWPLFGLSLRTPRLELRIVRDDDLPGFADAALAGIHDPAVMPFASPWTDSPPDELMRNAAKFHWGMRTSVGGDSWQLGFCALIDGRVVGAQDVRTRDYSVSRTISTGSWLTRAEHGRGLGKEMRLAVLLFAFDHLGAHFAETSAASWNEASIGVTRSLGYESNGSRQVSAGRAGTAVNEVFFRVDPNTLVRPDWQLQVSGHERALEQLVGSRSR